MADQTSSNICLQPPLSRVRPGHAPKNQGTAALVLVLTDCGRTKWLRLSDLETPPGNARTSNRCSALFTKPFARTEFRLSGQVACGRSMLISTVTSRSRDKCHIGYGGQPCDPPLGETRGSRPELEGAANGQQGPERVLSGRFARRCSCQPNPRADHPHEAAPGRMDRLAARHHGGFLLHDRWLAGGGGVVEVLLESQHGAPGRPVAKDC